MEKKNNSSKGIKAFLKSRKARHGSLAVVLVIAAVALVVVLNIVVGLLVERFPNLKMDLTSNSAYALSDDAEDFMSHLDKDVNMYILSPENDFVGNGEYFVQAKNLLEKMEAASNGKFTVSYIDTTSNPSFTNKYKNIDWSSKDTMAVMECGDRYQGVKTDDCFTYDEQYLSAGYYQVNGTTIEQATVTAAMKVTTENQVVVDFITGSQESDYTALKSLISNNAYDVREVSLLTDDLDEDAQFAIIYAPKVDLDAKAVEKLEKWLDNDGKYGRNLIYIPTPENTDTPNAEALIEEWGMKLTDGFVYETSEDHLLSSSDMFVFITDYNEYYTDGLKNKDIPVMVYQTRGIEITDENTSHALLNASDRAGIFPTDADDSFKPEDGITGKKIAVAAESVKSNSDAESRLIIYGSDRMFSSDFMTMNSLNNADFFMSVLNTVSDKSDESVTITGKKLDNTELGVTDVNTTGAMSIIFIGVIPIAILITGIIVWLRRRHM